MFDKAKIKRKRGKEKPFIYPEGVRFLYSNNRQFLTDRRQQLPYRNEVLHHLRGQIPTDGITGITSCYMFLNAVMLPILFSVTFEFARALLIQRDNLKIATLIVMMIMDGFYLLASYWQILYLYGFIKFARHGDTGEKTYDWLRADGKISVGKITSVFKQGSKTTIVYNYGAWGMMTRREYMTTADTNMSVNDPVVVLHNAIASTLL